MSKNRYIRPQIERIYGARIHCLVTSETMVVPRAADGTPYNGTFHSKQANNLWDTGYEEYVEPMQRVWGKNPEESTDNNL